MVQAVFPCLYPLSPPFRLLQLAVHLTDHVPVIIFLRIYDVRLNLHDSRIQHMGCPAFRQGLDKNAGADSSIIKQCRKRDRKRRAFRKHVYRKTPDVDIMSGIMKHKVGQRIRVNPVRRHNLPCRRYPSLQHAASFILLFFLLFLLIYISADQNRHSDGNQNNPGHAHSQYQYRFYTHPGISSFSIDSNSAATFLSISASALSSACRREPLVTAMLS